MEKDIKELSKEELLEKADNYKRQQRMATNAAEKELAYTQEAGRIEMLDLSKRAAKSKFVEQKAKELFSSAATITKVENMTEDMTILVISQSPINGKPTLSTDELSTALQVFAEKSVGKRVVISGLSLKDLKANGGKSDLSSFLMNMKKVFQINGSMFRHMQSNIQKKFSLNKSEIIRPHNNMPELDEKS